MGRLGEVTLGEIGRALARYRPAVIAVLVLVVFFQVLPDRGGDSLVDLGSARTGDEVAAGDGATTTTVAGGDATATTPTDGSAATSFAGTGSSGTVSSGSSLSGSDEVIVDDTGDDSLPAEGSSSGSGSGTGSGSSGSSGTTEPLRVLTWAWATRTAGTPLAASEVPEGTLPVGKRVGTDDKRSFVRLAGQSTSLVLLEEPSGNRNPAGAAVAVQACQITAAGWDPGPGKTFDQAPAYDAAQCVAGVRTPQGSWTFDLARFATRTDGRGFALVPGGDAIDFQVAFKLSS